MSSKMTKKDGIEAAMSVADDIASGKLDPAELDAQVVAECRELFARVEGPDDPLWDLQVDVFRQVLAVGGACGANELAEWVAVYRHLEADAPVGPSWIERALAEGATDD